MIACPACHEPMDRVRNRHGVHHACAACHGRWVGLGVLRKSVDRAAVNEVWRRAVDEAPVPAIACPACAASMREVSVLRDSVHLDVCTRCHMVWFDGGELDAMPAVKGPPPPPELSPKARAVLAMHKVRELETRQPPGLDWEGETPDQVWKWVPSLFGLPVEMESRSLTRWPVATGLFALILVAVHLLLKDHASAASAWGFLPADALRHQGLTLWSSMLLHGGAWHLLGNVYFLLLTGDDVEDLYGIQRLVLVLLLASAAGCAAHWLGDPRGEVPLIGASGAISGIIAMYALMLPHARIGLPLRIYYAVRWLSMPAWFAFVLWMLWQVAGAWLQLEGFGNVSALAHLGGALVGVLAWLVWRDRSEAPALS